MPKQFFPTLLFNSFFNNNSITIKTSIKMDKNQKGMQSDTKSAMHTKDNEKKGTNASHSTDNKSGDKKDSSKKETDKKTNSSHSK